MVNSSMRYTIEYLRESGQAESVCHTVQLDCGTLEDVGNRAFADAPWARRFHGANGFQIRDAEYANVVVALEKLD